MEYENKFYSCIKLIRYGFIVIIVWQIFFHDKHVFTTKIKLSTLKMFMQKHHIYCNRIIPIWERDGDLDELDLFVLGYLAFHFLFFKHKGMIV